MGRQFPGNLLQISKEGCPKYILLGSIYAQEFSDVVSMVVECGAIRGKLNKAFMVITTGCIYFRALFDQPLHSGKFPPPDGFPEQGPVAWSAFIEKIRVLCQQLAQNFEIPFGRNG